MGEPLRDDAMLVRGGTSAPVYLLADKDGQAHWIDNRITFEKLGFSWKQVHSVPQIIIDHLQMGKTITI